MHPINGPNPIVILTLSHGSHRYGGHALCDDISSLSNECAKTCNRCGMCNVIMWMAGSNDNRVSL